MDQIFTMDEDEIIKKLRSEIQKLTRQRNEIQIKYDKLIGKLKDKKIQAIRQRPDCAGRRALCPEQQLLGQSLTPEQQEIIRIFHPVKINNYLEKY